MVKTNRRDDSFVEDVDEDGETEVEVRVVDVDVDVFEELDVVIVAPEWSGGLLTNQLLW